MNSGNCSTSFRGYVAPDLFLTHGRLNGSYSASTVGLVLGFERRQVTVNVVKGSYLHNSLSIALGSSAVCMYELKRRFIGNPSPVHERSRPPTSEAYTGVNFTHLTNAVVYKELACRVVFLSKYASRTLLLPECTPCSFSERTC